MYIIQYNFLYVFVLDYLCIRSLVQNYLYILLCINVHCYLTVCFLAIRFYISASKTWNLHMYVKFGKGTNNCYYWEFKLIVEGSQYELRQQLGTYTIDFCQCIGVWFIRIFWILVAGIFTKISISINYQMIYGKSTVQ